MKGIQVKRLGCDSGNKGPNIELHFTKTQRLIDASCPGRIRDEKSGKKEGGRGVDRGS